MSHIPAGDEKERVREKERKRDMERERERDREREIGRERERKREREREQHNRNKCQKLTSPWSRKDAKKCRSEVIKNVKNLQVRSISYHCVKCET